MHCVLFGPPGSGKSTQAEALCKRFGMSHVSTGDILRRAGKRGTKQGLRAQALIAKGSFVPDDVVNGIVREEISRLHQGAGGILFDGYPRNLVQAQALDASLGEAHCGLDVAIVLEIPDAALLERICGRWSCESCGAGFNVYSMAPKEEGKCDRCGGALRQRKDDKEETLRGRLAIYRDQTLPLLDYYSAKNLLIRVAANGTVAEIRDSLLSGIEAKEAQGG